MIGCFVTKVADIQSLERLSRQISSAVRVVRRERYCTLLGIFPLLRGRKRMGEVRGDLPHGHARVRDGVLVLALSRSVGFSSIVKLVSHARRTSFVLSGFL